MNIHGEMSYPLGDRLSALGIPFVFATGYDDTQHPEQHLQAPTLIKRYSIADLGSVMARFRQEGT